ncbi:MAG: hypothetical protein ACOCRK_01935 [bacterium]
MFEKIKITEYDLRKANINVLYSGGLISKEKYIELKNSDKKKRVIEVGLMFRDDKKLHAEFTKRLKRYVDTFIMDNNLEDNIYEVVKDAVWVYGRYPKKRKYNEYVEFIKKREATSVLPIGLRNIVFYYNSLEDVFFQRGLGDISLKEYPILKKIKMFMALKESNQYKTLYKRVHEYELKYLREELKKDHRKSILKKDFEKSTVNKDDNYKIIKILVNKLL